MEPISRSDAREEWLSTVFDALSSRRRRALLSLLADAGGTESVRGLVRALDERSADPSTPPRGRLRTSLVHVHLPKLEQSGLVAVGDDGVTLTVAGAYAESLRHEAARQFSTLEC